MLGSWSLLDEYDYVPIDLLLRRLGWEFAESQPQLCQSVSYV